MPTQRLLLVDPIEYSWRATNGVPLPASLALTGRRGSDSDHKADDPAAVRNREYQRRHRAKLRAVAAAKA